MSGLSIKIADVLEEEGKLAVTQIVESMIANGQWASGRTGISLRVEADETKMIVYAPDYFETLETGISPQMARSASSFLRKKLYGWSIDKGMIFADQKERWRFSSNASRVMQESGSMLFRAGGRDDVYSDKVNPLVERIKQRLSERIVNVKLITNG